MWKAGCSHFDSLIIRYFNQFQKSACLYPHSPHIRLFVSYNLGYWLCFLWCNRKNTFCINNVSKEKAWSCKKYYRIIFFFLWGHYMFQTSTASLTLLAPCRDNSVDKRPKHWRRFFNRGPRFRSIFRRRTSWNK